MLPSSNFRLLIISEMEHDPSFALDLLRHAQCQTEFAEILFNFLRSHFLRPLNTHPFSETRSLDCSWWATPVQFALTFRVASYEQLQRLAIALRSALASLFTITTEDASEAGRRLPSAAIASSAARSLFSLAS